MVRSIHSAAIHTDCLARLGQMNSGAGGAATTDAASVHTMPESFDHLFGFGLPSASAFYRASFGLLVYNIHYMLALVGRCVAHCLQLPLQKLIAAILFCLHMLHIRSAPCTRRSCSWYTLPPQPPARHATTTRYLSFFCLCRAPQPEEFVVDFYF